MNSEMFSKSEEPHYFIFLQKYSKSGIKVLKNFSKRLKRYCDSVENAVAYDYGNCFIARPNSRLKMIKRTMCGHYGKQLLEVQLRYMTKLENG